MLKLNRPANKKKQLLLLAHQRTRQCSTVSMTSLFTVHFSAHVGRTVARCNCRDAHTRPRILRLLRRCRFPSSTVIIVRNSYLPHITPFSFAPSSPSRRKYASIYLRQWPPQALSTVPIVVKRGRSRHESRTRFRRRSAFYRTAKEGKYKSRECAMSLRESFPHTPSGMRCSFALLLTFTSADMCHRRIYH
jgi:hypothetical protein